MKFNISARRAAVAALPALAIAFCGLPAALAQSVPDPAQPWNWSDEFVRSQVNQVRAGRNLNPDTWPEVIWLEANALIRLAAASFAKELKICVVVEAATSSQRIGSHLFVPSR